MKIVTKPYQLTPRQFQKVYLILWLKKAWWMIPVFFVFGIPIYIVWQLYGQARPIPGEYVLVSIGAYLLYSYWHIEHIVKFTKSKKSAPHFTRRYFEIDDDSLLIHVMNEKQNMTTPMRLADVRELRQAAGHYRFMVNKNLFLIPFSAFSSIEERNAFEQRIKNLKK